MYCKACGEKSIDAANYCPNDGTLLLPLTASKFNAAATKHFCPDCGTPGKGDQNYCQSCGSSMTQFSKGRSGAQVSIPAINTESLQSGKLLSAVKLPGMDSFKQAIMPVIVSILALIIISFSLLTFSEEAFDALMADVADEADLSYMIEEIADQTGADIPALDKIFGLTDIIMVSHFVNPEFYASFDGEMYGEEGEAETSADMWSGLIIYLLVPFIALFIGGLVAGYRNRNTDKGLLESNLAISALYGLTLSVISLFAGMSFSEKIREDALNLDIKLGIDYSFFGSLFTGFIMAFVFAGLGILFAQNFRKFTGNLSEMIPYGEAIHQAFSTMVRGVILLFVFFVIFISSKLDMAKDWAAYELGLQGLIDKIYLLIITIAAQLSVYVWNLIHFGKFTFSGNEDGDVGSISYSVWSGLSANGEGEQELFFLEKGLEMLDIPLYLKLAFIIPILLFVWAGYRIASKGNGIIELAVFSFVYAILLAGIAAITDMGFTAELSGFDSGKMEMAWGFSGFGMFIRSFLFAFLFSYAGSWLTRLRQS
jgi:hypothetical protein